MPKNNNLTPVKLPMSIRFGEKPKTKFVNNLASIKVALIDAPSMTQLRNFIPQFIDATWTDEPTKANGFTLKQKDTMILEALQGKALPTALETIGLTFRIEGISIQEVTHILRHRMASFSADCSGDKWWSHKDALVPHSIQNSNGTGVAYPGYQGSIPPTAAISSDDFHMRYKQIVAMSKQLYCDMIDSKKISIMDARYILPRCLSTFYFMRMNIKDVIAFIVQRMDKQIQPETDNVLAYKMYIELLKQFPILNDLIDIHSPSKFYVNTARTGKATNLYFPDEDSDIFEWNENDFIYQCRRDEMNGTGENAENLFTSYMKHCEMNIAEIQEDNFVKLETQYMLDESGDSDER